MSSGDGEGRLLDVDEGLADRGHRSFGEVAPADCSPWPLRPPTRAQAADSLIGRRVVIRRVNEVRTWRDLRNYRAVSPIVAAQRDPNEQMVRVIDEASWYSAPGNSSIPAVLGLEAFRVWIG